jgi:hypothetical protein
MDTMQTLALLDKLTNLGFNDEAFWRLHHFRQQNKKESIASFRRYCKKTSTFRREGPNGRVHERLVFVLNKYREHYLPHGQTNIFIGLAEAAFDEIPPV